MSDQTAYKTPAQIKKDLERISPLALPDYLSKCDFYDRTDAYQTLDNAIEKFRGTGGLAGNLVETTLVAVINSVGLCLAKKFLPKKTYNELCKCGGNAFGSACKEALTFSLKDYGPEEQNLYSVEALEQDRLRRNMVRQAGVPDSDGNFEPQFDAEKYRRNKDWKGDVRSSDYPKSKSTDGRTVEGVGKKKLYINKGDTNGDRSLMAEGDHVIPLKTLHDKTGYFSERYVDLDKMVDVVYTDSDGKEHHRKMTLLQQLANDDANFQILSGDQNAAKGGGRTNKEYIKYCEDIEVAAEIKKKLGGTTSSVERKKLQTELNKLGLSETQKKAAALMSKDPATLTERERKQLEKYKLSEAQKEEMRKNQEQMEKKIRNTLLTEGAKSVAKEQIGKIIVAMVGPISFEIRDSISNGISHGFEGYDKFDAFCKRLWRAFRHICRRLTEILKDAIGDLAKMIATFFMNACKMLKDMFGKLFDLALSGISVIVESVKVLIGGGTVAQKGEAILKILVGFITGILGQTAIDVLLESVGIPDPFAEILATILSTALSCVVMSLFSELDILGVRREMLRKKIDEIFDARAKALKCALDDFDMVTMQVHRNHRIALESLRTKIADGIKTSDFDAVNASLDGVLALYNIDLPYSNPMEFMAYIKNYGRVVIE